MERNGLPASATWGGMLLAGLLLLVSCGTVPHPKDQGWYQAQIASDRGELIDGTLEYPRVGTLKVGEKYFFVVTLSGTLVTVSPSPGRTTYPSPVSVGGAVGVTLTCTGIDCAAESSTRQNIVTPGDVASWAWTLTAHQAGPAHVSLKATTFDRDTNNVLLETHPIDQEISITATLSYTAHRLAAWAMVLAGFVGAGAIGAAGRYLWRRFHKTTSIAAKTSDSAKAVPSEPSTKADGQSPSRKPPS